MYRTSRDTLPACIYRYIHIFANTVHGSTKPVFGLLFEDGPPPLINSSSKLQNVAYGFNKK
jgi:hypothetical protein